MAGPLLVLSEFCTGFQLVPAIPVPSKFGADVAVVDGGASRIVEVGSVDCAVLDALKVSRIDAGTVVDRA